jgi:pyridoxamine 5'-phosphate oxidase
MEQRFADNPDIPRPESWGGFVIEPERIEFWAGRTSRLHDRVSFTREADGWSVTRLQP